MSKYTQGPWEILTLASSIGISYRIHAGDKDIAHIPREWAYEPDARLIAAAPDLLEALKGCLEQCVARHDEQGSTPNEMAEIKAAQAAIAKATEGQ